MAKKSTDYDWEPKSRGDKLVSFLIWMIIVVLIIYGALIYKNRKELFNLKQKKLASSPTPVVVKVKKVNEELSSRIVKKPVIKTKIIKKAKPKIIKKESTLKIETKSNIQIPTLIKKKTIVKTEKKVSTPVKKVLSKVYYLRIYPFSQEKLARNLYKKIKIKPTGIAYKLLKIKGNYVLLAKANVSTEELRKIKSIVFQDGLKVEVFLSEKEAQDIKNLNITENLPVSKAIKTDKNTSTDKGSYLVQVGSFGNAKAAQDLQVFLRKNSPYKNVFIVPGEKNGRVYYKVRVGYFLNRAAAEECGKNLKNRFPGKIISFWAFKGK